MKINVALIWACCLMFIAGTDSSSANQLPLASDDPLAISSLQVLPPTGNGEFNPADRPVPITTQDLVLELPSGEFLIVPRDSKTVGTFDQSVSLEVSRPSVFAVKHACDHPGDQVAIAPFTGPSVYVRENFWNLIGTGVAKNSMVYDKVTHRFNNAGVLTYKENMYSVLIWVVAMNFIGILLLLVMVWKWRFFTIPVSPNPLSDRAVRNFLISLVMIAFTLINLFYGSLTDNTGLIIVSLVFIGAWLVAVVGSSVTYGTKSTPFFAVLRWPTLILGLTSFYLAVCDRCTSW
jgi:hypothetical protein